MQELVKVQNDIVRENNAKLIGRKFEILVEGPVQGQAGVWRGRTRTAKPLIAWAELGKAIAPGLMVDVKIEEAGTWFLKGSIVN